MDDDNIISFEEKASLWRRADLLAQRPRIRREAKLPGWAAHEAALKCNYPKKLAISAPAHSVVYRQERWEYLDDEKDIAIRSTFAWILREGERIGAFEFKEYNLRLPDNENLHEFLDGESYAMACLAKTLCEAWEWVGFDVGSYGTILEIENIWMLPRISRPGLWLGPVEELLGKLSAKASLIVLHHFPEEYTGRTGDDVPSRIGFGRRMAAMTRFCARRWGMKLFPGPPAEEGWMWRIPDRVSEFIDPPQHNPDWLPG